MEVVLVFVLGLLIVLLIKVLELMTDLNDLKADVETNKKSVGGITKTMQSIIKGVEWKE